MLATACRPLINLKAAVAVACALLAGGNAHGNIFYDDDIAFLRSETGMYDGDVAFVTAYYSGDSNDRGGGKFVWRATAPGADDGGRFITPTPTNGGCWVRLLEGQRANVEMWGAKGNDVADNTACIQKAVNACVGPWCTELVFPAGSYSISNTIVFNSSLHITGEGVGNSTVRMNGDHDVFRSNNAQTYLTLGTNACPSGCFDSFLIFENLRIDCGGSNSVNNAALTVALPGEPTIIRNISTRWGAYGVRCFGVGTPGLKILTSTFNDATVAGVAVEGCLPNGNVVGPSGGPVTLIGVSGDNDNRPDSTASLFRFYRCSAIASIVDFRAEGYYSGGLINYNWSQAWPSGSADINGGLNISGGNYSSGNSEENPSDFIVLNSDGPRVPAVYIAPIHLYNVRYLIRDDKTGRQIKPDIQIGSGLMQGACRLPVQYEGYVDCPNRTREVVGDTIRYDLYPPSIGWYRVLEGAVPARMAGRLIISSRQEASEIGIDAVAYPAASEMNVTVNRASRDDGSHYEPRVTMVRWGIYGNPADYYAKPFVDIYVASVPSSDDPIRLAMPIEGNMSVGLGDSQLLAPTAPITSIVPTNGCLAHTNTTLLTCTTNSLTY